MLTAPAQTYSPAILRHDPFGLVLDCIAERGAVVLLQRVLWGEQSADVRLAALLLDARIAFELLCGTATRARAWLNCAGWPFTGVDPPARPTEADGRHLPDGH